MKNTENSQHSLVLNEYQIQAKRIEKVLDETMHKLKFLKYLPTLIEYDGMLLKRFLKKTEVDYILKIFDKGTALSMTDLSDRFDLFSIHNMLERINKNEKNELASGWLKKQTFDIDVNVHVAYALNTLYQSSDLLHYIQNLDVEYPPFVKLFIDTMLKLQHLVNTRFKITGQEEVVQENELKNVYRSNKMILQYIEELEKQLEKQRQELGEEHDHKEEILKKISEKIVSLREKAANEIFNIVYDSEVIMMKDYIQSSDKQEQLEEDAKEARKLYEDLLERNLYTEKMLRTTKTKTEAHLTSWITKYDIDVGEKQAECDKLEETYQTEKNEMELLQEKFDEQEEQYLMLMQEKEDEERLIMEEKAWIFLQNRCARRIQRCWKAYITRKLARRARRKARKNNKNRRKKNKTMNKNKK